MAKRRSKSSHLKAGAKTTFTHRRSIHQGLRYIQVWMYQMFKRCKCVLPRQIINSYRVEQQVYGLSLLLLTVQVCDLTNTDIYLCKWIVLNFIWILSRYKTLEMTSGDGALEGKAHVSFILVTASFHLILSVRSGTKSHCYSTGTCAFPSLSTVFTISAGKKHFKIIFLSL